MDTRKICEIAQEYALKMSEDKRFECPGDIVICCGIMKYAADQALTKSISENKPLTLEEFFE